MSDVLAICTRNRHLDLERCLRSVANQSEMPATIYVVDSSTNVLSLEITEEFSREILPSEVRYLRSESRGLVMARNLVLANLPSHAKVIHFIDDDTELEENYIAEINKVLESHENYVGAGGVVKSEAKRVSKKLGRLFLLDSETLGKVLASGVNIGSYESTEQLEMDWLPGCSMSFSVDHISGLRFDENRSIWPLGEDVDFGLKASAIGRLVHVPGAELFHHLSPTNRDEEVTIVFQDVIHRWTLAKDRLGRVRRRWVFASTIGLIFIYLMSAVRHLDMHEVRKAAYALKGLWVSVFLGGLTLSKRAESSP